MAQKISIEQVKELKETIKVKKEVRYIKDIEALQKGEALFITDEEWTTEHKTDAIVYYRGNINKITKVVACKKITLDGKKGTMIEKL